MSLSWSREIWAKTERGFSPIAHILRCYKLREIERRIYIVRYNRQDRASQVPPASLLQAGQEKHFVMYTTNTPARSTGSQGHLAWPSDRAERVGKVYGRRESDP